MRNYFLPAVILQAIIAASGCSVFQKKSEPGYATVIADPCRDQQTAIEQTKRASHLLAKGKCSEAEEALHQALIADVTYAPAHNNLGSLYLSQGKLYLAAWEFEYARKLMPDNPGVCNNLGLVYESADRLDKAIEYYQTANQMDSRNPEFIGNLARALLTRDEQAVEVQTLLSDLVLYDTRPEWIGWAREQLAVGNLPTTPASSTRPRPQINPPVEILPPSVTIPEPLSSDNGDARFSTDSLHYAPGQHQSNAHEFPSRQ